MVISGSKEAFEIHIPFVPVDLKVLFARGNCNDALLHPSKIKT